LTSREIGVIVKVLISTEKEKIMDKRTFNFGKIAYYGDRKINRVTVDMEYKQRENGKKVFSVSASVWNGNNTDIVLGGQCLDKLFGYLGDDKIFCEIYRLWKLYHLNGMHPECIHQYKLGWHKRALEKRTLYHWSLKNYIYSERRDIKNAALSALRDGKIFTPTKDQITIYNLSLSLTTPTDTLPKNMAAYYEPKKPLYRGDTGFTEEKQLGWIKEEEHPEGLLGKVCPVCGYKYGSGWNYFPIPEEDKMIIYKLLNDGHL
jgi:hypothetical protein